MAWTKEQQLAIDKRNSNILVSAAAGSGKTAVLVERIISQILDEENPCDVDEFLVVTFTKAAAAQMKDKITKKISEILDEKPDNEHLAKQLILINHANIETIDSFCLSVVKENFGLLGLDSAFNIGDNGMIEMIKNDVMDKLFDELYNSKDADEKKTFYSLLDVFSSDKEDVPLKGQINKICMVATSYSRPYEWLDKAKNMLETLTVDNFDKQPWFKDYVRLVHSLVSDSIAMAGAAEKICELPGGPDVRMDNIASDVAHMEVINNEFFLDGLRNEFSNGWSRAKAVKGEGYDPELKKAFDEIRNTYKKQIDEHNLFDKTKDKLALEIDNMKQYLIPLIDLTIRFMKMFDEEKNKRKLMDFSDVEHFAYKLVCAGCDDNNRPIPTALGKMLSKRYKEIFIDEYQDSNYLQEDILCSVSRMHEGVYNMFMVGDVKQSIYGFRMARPDLFISKYLTYKEEGNEVKIELKNNFRSRHEVLDAANYICYQLMGEDIGRISYNADVELVTSKEYPVPDDKIKDGVRNKAEILLANYFETPENLDKVEIECYMIAQRINELMDRDNITYVYDEELKAYRPVSYRDIVILSRNGKGFGKECYDILTKMGIPAYLEEEGEYFQATEIQIIIALLSVVDNIKLDIMMAAVLLSPMANLDENELAVVEAFAVDKSIKDHALYDKCICYIADKEDAISAKLSKIIDVINNLVEIKNSVPISTLIWKAITDTNYYIYAQAMPMGSKRKANIDMLLEKAEAFYSGGYKGLFNFLRYVDKLKTNNTSFGEASIVDDSADVVKIITMHKSKGLEYPIVFVSGTGKEFNLSDSKQNVIIHNDYFMTSKVFYEDKRYMHSSTMRDMYQKLIIRDSLAEEMRVLYVALTRAKEKVIITGCDKDIDKTLETLSNRLADADNTLLPFNIRYTSKKFLSWILAGIARKKTMTGYTDEIFDISIMGEEDIKMDIVNYASAHFNKYDDIVSKAVDYSNGEVYLDIKKQFENQYAYDKLTSIRSKMSISDIKKMKAYDIEDDANEKPEFDFLDDENIDDKSVDNTDKSADAGESVDNTDKSVDAGKSVDKKSDLSGSERGTLVHKFMELISFKDMPLDVDGEKRRSVIFAFMDKLVETSIFDDREKAAINPWKINKFFESKLGERMVKADTLGKLYKEQQFSAGLTPDEIYDDITDETDDVVIIQGIIDAYFYEEDGIVIMDYKTDRATEAEIIGRYKAQLDYYGLILERITGVKVKEKIIYSFGLEKEINLE